MARDAAYRRVVQERPDLAKAYYDREEQRLLPNAALTSVAREYAREEIGSIARVDPRPVVGTSASAALSAAADAEVERARARGEQIRYSEALRRVTIARPDLAQAVVDEARRATGPQVPIE
jgi:hypothetical protein